MDNNTEKLIIEKNYRLVKDLIKTEEKDSDIEFINSDEAIVLKTAIYNEEGNLVYQ
jgi:hypothetical protein